MIYYILVIFSVLAAAGSQMLLKQGARLTFTSWWKQYLNGWVISGYFVLGLTLLLNIFCMSHGVEVKEISIIESLSYLFVPSLSWVCFREKLTWQKMLSDGIIVIGIIVFFWI